MRSALIVLALASGIRAAPASNQPALRYTVSPIPIRGGVEVTISIPAFGSKRLICSAFVAGTECESDEQPCGPQAAVLRMTPTSLSVGKVGIGVTACTGSQRANNPGECWSYGGDVASDYRPPAGSASATPARGDPAPVPGGLADTAPALLRSAAPPAAPPAGQTSGNRWSAEPASKPAPAPAGRRQFRGHDGRVYYREKPAKDSPADKDEQYRRALAGDPTVRAAFENWRNLDDTARHDALQRMSDIQADTYGVARSQVVLRAGGKPGQLAHYSRADRKLTMNTASPYYNSPTMQVNAVTHEARHRWQHSLVERLRSPGLVGEERVLGEAFKVSFDNYCSVGGVRSCDYATYRNQLVERDAFEQGEAAALYLRLQRQ